MARHAGEFSYGSDLAKIDAVKQIEVNDGKTLVSEGINSNYQDIVNYAVFALIHLKAFEE